MGFVTTLAERQEWLAENNVVGVDRNGNAVAIDWTKASAAQVNQAYNSVLAARVGDAATSLFAADIVAARAVSSLGPGATTTAVGMIGANGTQVFSKTLRTEGGARIDVENPAPGQRAGQIHYQEGNNTYYYDFETGQFQGLSRTKNADLLSRPVVQDAIQKGLKYLGM